jgi:lipid A 3-O-deacylase
MGARAAALALCAALTTGIGGARAQEVAVLGGWHDFSHSAASSEAGLEFRQPLAWRHLVWVAGAGGTADGAAWLYSGLQRPLPLGSGWRVTPTFAIELYSKGSDGKDLGQALQFRSMVELSHPWGRRMRVGLAAYHVSNGSLSDKNPGHNSLVLVISRSLR